MTKPIQSAAPAQQPGDSPLIPLDVLDAPKQRLYVFGFYVFLLAWRLHNAWNVTDELDSTWLFLKWVGIDAAFFVALPAFRIPWLQWSFFTTLTIWLLHMFANMFLMYRIPIPIITWLGALVKVAYDRELSISEHRVKPADILHNSSIILGKQIIQILPEGSAILNPQKQAFCLDSTRTSIELPIQINQTTPISIELLRHDLDTDEVEIITIGSKQAKKLKNEADRGRTKSDANTPQTLYYQVSKRGLYQLARVIDQSKLEVRKRSYDVAVVACPSASVTVDANHKCMGDLSGISLHVEGVPPFKVKYSKRINQHQYSSITQSIQPEDYDQGIMTDGGSDIVLDPKHPHRMWTKSQKVSVQINESLGQNGTWSYHIEEVEDGLENKAMFDTDKIKRGSIGNHFRSMTVHRRPIITLDGCDSQHSLRVAKGESMELPVRIKPSKQMPAQDWPMNFKYTFTPETDSENSLLEEHEHDMSHENASPRVVKAGRYSLESIASQYCQGEVQEPSSCTLYNPPEPDLAMQYEEISDKCAGNPIGMEVNLDFTGTPPFNVRYTVTHRGTAHQKAQKFNSMRGQILLHEKSAGSYTYQINEIEDQVYGPVSLKDRDLVIKQDIKPAADAAFSDNRKSIRVCLGEPVSMPVRFQGEGPWDLDYEIVHGGKRKKFSIHSEAEVTMVDLPEQSEGGRYAIVLTTVQDTTKCKQILTDERHVEVRGERPSVSFGDIDGRRTVQTLEGNTVKIPLRLQGVGPWTVSIQNTDHTAKPRKHVLHDPNAVISESASGIYELISVHDSCPGVVDPKANKFQITWIERPSLNLKDSTVSQISSGIYQKAAVCQGDEDTLNLALSGSPPYEVKYQMKAELIKGSGVTSNKPLSIATNNMLVNMDTSRAGEYTYTFNHLADNRYGHDRRHFSPLQIKQHVYALPTAKFANPGKTYSYCKDDPILSSSSEAETEQIPIVLTGTPPFSIEIAINHHGASQRPEVTRIKDIPSNTFSWSLSRAAFDLGTHNLQIRSVKDSRSCESILDTGSSSVRIHVSSPPTIVPLESAVDYCVGDRVSFSLSGQAPFDVFYNFQNRERKAHITSHEFKRIAESPGEFVITGVSDAAMGTSGKCKARKDIRKSIHPYPSVRISRGKTLISDIHEGGEVDIHFDFTGTPPFEFTYVPTTFQSQSFFHILLC